MKVIGVELERDQNSGDEVSGCFLKLQEGEEEIVDRGDNVVSENRMGNKVMAELPLICSF